MKSRQLALFPKRRSRGIIHTCITEIGFAEAKILAHDGNHRCRGESRHERREESEPAQVERAHVWQRKREQVNLQSLMLRINRQRELRLGGRHD